MFLKNKLIFAILMVSGFSMSAMEMPDTEMTEKKSKCASTVEEWKFLYDIASSNSSAVKNYIMNKGNLDIVDEQGQSPLEIAINHNCIMCMYYLTENGKVIVKESALLDAIEVGSFKAAITLIKDGCNVNSYTFYGNSLILAIIQKIRSEFEAEELIHLLIEKKVDLNFKGYPGSAYEVAYKYMEKRDVWNHKLLKLLKPQEEMVEDCPICLDDLSTSKLIVTKCNHKFHEQCLNESKKTRNNCPLCRANL